MIERVRALAFGLIVAYLVVAPLFFSAVTIESFEFPKALLLRAVALALLALGAIALAEWALGRQLGARVRGGLAAARHDPIVLGGCAWLLAGALSTAASLSPHVSLRGAHESFAGFATLASYAVLFTAARIVVRSIADLRLVLVAALAAGAGATLYGLIQLFGADPIAWSAVAQSGGLLRIASTMGNPNFLGGYLAMVFPAGLCLAIQEYRRGARVVALAIALVLGAGIVVSFATLSRGVAIAYGAGIGVLVLGWWRTGERAGAAWIAGVSVALALLSGVFIASTEVGPGYARRALVRLERTLQPQRDLRVEFWTAALSMYRAKPVLGTGLDTFQLGFPRHARPSFRRRVPESTPGRAHNQLLHTAATQGTVGVVAGLLFLGAFIAGWLRALRLADSEEERTLVVALGAGLAALLARNLVGFTVVAVGGLACVFVGALARRAYGRSKQWEPPLLSPRRAGAAFGAGIAIAGAVFLANALSALVGSIAGAVGVAAALTAAVACTAFGILPNARRRGDRTQAKPNLGVEGAVDRASGTVSRASRVVVCALVAAALIAAILQTVLRPVAADMYARKAHDLMESMRPDAAVPLFERAAQLDPGRVIHWIELGIAHHAVASTPNLALDDRRTHLQRALFAHLRSAELVPANSNNQANVARGFTELGSWTIIDAPDESKLAKEFARLRAEVYARFDTALELDPYARAVYFDATKAARNFRDEPALTHYASIWQEHYPTRAQARAQLGIAAMMRSDWTTAEAQLIAATQGNWQHALSDEVGNWVNLSSTQLELGNASDAHASSEAALGLVARYLPALRVRARALELLAIASDGEQLRGGKVASLQRQRAIEYRRQAAADWNAWLTGQPDDAEAREALARLSARAESEHETRARNRSREDKP